MVSLRGLLMIFTSRVIPTQLKMQTCSISSWFKIRLKESSLTIICCEGNLLEHEVSQNTRDEFQSGIKSRKNFAAWKFSEIWGQTFCVILNRSLACLVWASYWEDGRLIQDTPHNTDDIHKHWLGVYVIRTRLSYLSGHEKATNQPVRIFQKCVSERSHHWLK